MFEPGHLHLVGWPGGPAQPGYALDLYYEVRRDPQEGPMVHFRLCGEVDGRRFEEAFELHRDTAFNFPSVATRRAAKHGVPQSFGPVLREHKDFDAMFEDIRARLDSHSGEPVNLDHLQKDGL